MARRNPGKHSTGFRAVAANVATRRHHRQRARGGDTEGVHRLADQIFAQHRPYDCIPVAAPRERRGPGALQMQVNSLPVTGDEFAE